MVPITELTTWALACLLSEGGVPSIIVDDTRIWVWEQEYSFTIDLHVDHEALPHLQFQAHADLLPDVGNRKAVWYANKVNNDLVLATFCVDLDLRQLWGSYTLPIQPGLSPETFVTAAKAFPQIVHAAVDYLADESIVRWPDEEPVDEE